MWSIKASQAVCLTVKFVFTAELKSLYPHAFPSICPLKGNEWPTSLADNNYEAMHWSLNIM